MIRLSRRVPPNPYKEQIFCCKESSIFCRHYLAGKLESPNFVLSENILRIAYRFCCWTWLFSVVNVVSDFRMTTRLPFRNSNSIVPHSFLLSASRNSCVTRLSISVLIGFSFFEMFANDLRARSRRGLRNCEAELDVRWRYSPKQKKDFPAAIRESPFMRSENWKLLRYPQFVHLMEFWADLRHESLSEGIRIL